MKRLQCVWAESPRLSFLVTLAAAIAVALLLTTGCTSGPSEANSEFWDADGEVHGPVDSLVVTHISDFGGLAGAADAIVVVRVDAIEETTRQGEIPGDITAEDPEFEDDLAFIEEELGDNPLSTTYSATVEQWLKGDGSDEISIRNFGGLTSRGDAVFIDGYFLLEPGREYILLLNENGDSLYTHGNARRGFDITDGVVKVLNNPQTADLEHFERQSVDEFIEYVASLAGGD